MLQRLRLALLDHSFDVPDGHHVEVAVLNNVSAAGSMDYLAASDIDRDVSAVASIVVAYDVTYLEIASRHTDTVAVANSIRTVRQIYAGLCITVHYET